MKTIKNQLAIILLALITLSSCKNDEKKADNKTNTTPKKDSTKIAVTDKTITLFSINNEDDTETIEISGSEASDDDEFLLDGDKNVLIASKYKKNKESLQLIKTDTLLVSDYNYVYMDSNSKRRVRKKVQNVDYFLFSFMESPLGNGDPSKYLSFIMLNMDTLKFYTLQYIGEHSLVSGEALEGDFAENKTLDSNPEIKKELYEFANKSKWIYTPTGKEKDINYYKNFENKWYSDNAPKNGKSPDIITSTYYTEDLFKFNGNYDKKDFIENDSFKIVSYFRNNILGYDKNKKLYFPIIVESCNHGCGKTIKFVSENEIEVSFEISDQEPEIIDLNTIKFSNNPL